MKNTMKARVELDVRPFSIPNYVILKAEQGDATSASVKLSAMDEATLSSMCDQFRAEIFKAAGKTDPRLK